MKKYYTKKAVINSDLEEILENHLSVVRECTHKHGDLYVINGSETMRRESGLYVRPYVMDTRSGLLMDEKFITPGSLNTDYE